eukprot:Lankesteria_metandrocarpae@DN4860_c0_g1_i1.p1
MPMGIKIASAIFCQWLKAKLQDVLPHYALRIYQDDIFIAAKSAAELDQYSKQLLGALQRMHLAINPAKTQNSAVGINVLGLIYKNGIYAIPDASIKSIRELIYNICTHATMTKRMLYRVIGKLNFFRSLSPHTAALLAPIYSLTTTIATWHESVPVTDDLRQHLRQLAAHLDEWKVHAGKLTDTMCIYVDSSNTGIGVTVQDTVGEEIHHWSSKYASANSDAAAKELNGLLQFLRHNKPFLQQSTGTGWQVCLDNLPAVNFLWRSTVPQDDGKQKLLSKIFYELSSYQVEVLFYHVAGRDNTRADALSRIHDPS